MSKTQNVFDRARRVTESGSSKQCAAVIDELKQLQADEQAQADDVRPPGEQIIGGDGRVYRTLPAGPKFQQAAAMEGPDGEVAASDCTLQYKRLISRLAQAAELLNALQQRKASAEAEEKLAAAPGEARRAVAALDGLLDRHQAAREELAAIHAELKATFTALVEARQLDAAAPTLSLEQFYRAGVELAHTLPQRREAVEGGFSEPPRKTTPMFGSSRAAFGYAKVLVNIPQGLFERVRAVLGRVDAGFAYTADYRPDTSDSAVKKRLDDWYRELVRLLGTDDVEAARNVGVPTYPPKSRGRPRFDADVA